MKIVCYLMWTKKIYFPKIFVWQLVYVKGSLENEKSSGIRLNLTLLWYGSI